MSGPCPSCGFEENPPNAKNCGQCGMSFTRAGGVTTTGRVSPKPASVAGEEPAGGDYGETLIAPQTPPPTGGSSAAEELDVTAVIPPDELERAAPGARRAPTGEIPAAPCKSCGADNPPGSRFCVACGVSMEPATATHCPGCGAPVVARARFCGGCGRKVEELAAAAPAAVDAAPAAGRAATEVGARLSFLSRRDSLVASHPLADRNVTLGTKGADLKVADDPFVSPVHARFEKTELGHLVVDLDSLNGIYLRVTGPLTVSPGEQVIIGSTLLRFAASPRDVADLLPRRSEWPVPFGTRIRVRFPALAEILEGGGVGAFLAIPEGRSIIGQRSGEIRLTYDEDAADRHVEVTWSGPQLVLRDLGTRQGIYRRVEGSEELKHGDRLIIGRQRIRYECA